jgi:hypothetical protein
MNDELIRALICDVEALQIKVAALEAIISENPECKARYEALLRAAELQLLQEQQEPTSQDEFLFQRKKPN